MTFNHWHGFCLAGGREDLPPGAQPVETPFSPLVFLIRRDPLYARGWFALTQLAQLVEGEDLSPLTPCRAPLPQDLPPGLGDFVSRHGATVVNLSFARALRRLEDWRAPKTRGFRVALVGLGDVGRTVLTGLVLLGGGLLREIAIYDPNEALCARCEMEFNQVLSPDGAPLPRVVPVSAEDLFPCDLLVFTASRGVPGLDSGVRDVRAAQWEANRTLVAPYARQARAADFSGIFCQVADPVDPLARSVFLESSRDEAGRLDFAGLLPEQVQGFGLGVMAARAAYWARREGIPFSQGRVYGPHGRGLVVANQGGSGYDPALSQRLTRLTRGANLQVRALGFKPYIAPGLSSAAVSLIQLLRGEDHYGAVPLGGVYFGCRSRFTPQGLAVVREPLNPSLVSRLEQTYQTLRKEDPL